MKQNRQMLYGVALVGTSLLAATGAYAQGQGYYSPNGAYHQGPVYVEKIAGPRTPAAQPMPVQPMPAGMPYGGNVVVYENAPGVYQAAPAGYENAPYAPAAYDMPPAQPQTGADNPKDGSLFPGGSCVNCSKDGSLLGGGPCVNCSKDGSLLGGAPCENCDKDGSLLPGGPCQACTKDGSLFPGPCKKCAEMQQEIVMAPPAVQNYIPYTPVVYDAMQHDCCSLAPLALEHVDFRIQDTGADGPYTSPLGNYRFRIFGCRRYSKEAKLNSGRIMEKNINFASVFEASVRDCYKVLPMPQDLCLQVVPSELPEYVLTAEITDYYMNVCDEYDWDNAEKSNLRSGTAEMTVTWRLMDLTRNNVYWKGESTGYGELYRGEANGETKLIERSFADAVSNLRAIPGFEDQLAMRVDPVSMAAQRNALVEEERALNPIKCGYLKEYQCAKSCEVSRPGVDVSQGCGCMTPIPEPMEKVVEACIDANGQIREDGQCEVVDDTWVDTGDVEVLDNLCIVTTDPCKNLTPETVHRMRSSVVQIDSPNGRKGAGLLISEKMILTSGDLVDRDNNNYQVKTIRGEQLVAHAVRVNPSKNTALLVLESDTEYTPLALDLNLPEVGRNGYLTLGLLDVKDFKDGENYLENSARIEGYRYTEDKGAEIMVNTFVQNVTVGGGLFYKNCALNGIAHSGIRTNDGLDVFMPTETALRSLGICICGHEYVEESPWQQTIYKPVTEQITIIQEAPEIMEVKERK